MPKKNAEPKKDVYAIVTEKMIALLEKGVAPWKRPWKETGGAFAPLSMSTRKPYRGINLFLLVFSGYRSRWWGTYKKISELGGQVRKGERGTLAVYWSIIRKEETDPKTGEQTMKRLFFLRYYTVFNAEQADWEDGLPKFMEIADGRQAAPAEPALISERAAEIIAKMPNCPKIKFYGDRAFYSLTNDTVTIPPRSSFKDESEYWKTLFHELGHATGAPSRLGRHKVAEYVPHVFGSPNYSREELVAEMTASFLCAEVGVDSDSTMENSAAYLKAWIDALKADHRAVVIAASQAQKAADYILNRGEEIQNDEDSAAGPENKEEE